MQQSRAVFSAIAEPALGRPAEPHCLPSNFKGRHLKVHCATRKSPRHIRRVVDTALDLSCQLPAGKHSAFLQKNLIDHFSSTNKQLAAFAPSQPHTGCISTAIIHSDLSYFARLRTFSVKLAAPRRLLGALNSRLYPSPTKHSRTFIPAFVTVAPSRPTSRLNLFSGHLDSKPFLELNTPFSTERSAHFEDDQGNIIKEQIPPEPEKVIEKEKQVPKKMSSQPPHPALLIPGPIEFDDAVLQSMSHYSESHVGQPFVNTFGDVLSNLRKLFQTTDPTSQPFVISGSGTLGWDQVAANLAEPDEEVLILHTGYFADSFADCFETYGVKATQLKAPIGDRPQLDEVEKALKEKKYKIVTVTHVDTSTGVLSEIQALSELVHRVSPDTLVVVDGVCSVGGEEIKFDEWKLDVVLTATQKAIGCPAGLSVLMASGRAIEVFKTRKTRPTSYFGSWKNWLPSKLNAPQFPSTLTSAPVMQNYEAKKASYFATPSPQLIHALDTALKQILSRPLEQRFADHKAASQKIKKAVADLGLKQLAAKPENQANTMTAIYLPEGTTPPDVIPSLLKKGVVFAGGLHKEIASKYIRLGHMGVSVTDPNRDDLTKAISALKESLVEIGKA
ncbi:PLP-dependent transferase [Bimuria novae-zelandiae CBS 107.79]|uniref:alanine--glyoxylate transaminase n=1 Tax=Bimuria novae-zelandiae CBS 107.79 TaxID=1447943 RepID=A0A6A5V050_9PLEO|nr:PLP-dependent transferase [Bimuria novae-zelandiae CBS 107.79]